MEHVKYVGCEKTRPLRQELLKSLSGGMAAVSAGILALWFNSERPAEGYLHIAICVNALALPLLVCARLMYQMFDGYEYVTTRAAKIAERILLGGMGVACGAYFLMIFSVSKLAAVAFAIGGGIVHFSLNRLYREMDGALMRKSS